MYEYWFDSESKAHEISKMDSGYIKNCLKQLKKMLDSWGGSIPEQLTAEELQQKDEVGMKAWFVFNGLEYIEAFRRELEHRSQGE